MSLTQGLRRSLQQQPDALAVSFGERRQTFRELGDRVARMAGVLNALGMQREDRIAMLSLNSDRYLEYFMAVPWGGGVLNPCNIRWSPTELAYSLDDSDSSMLLFDDAFTPVAAALRSQCKTLRSFVYVGDGSGPGWAEHLETLMSRAERVPDAGRRGDDLAGIFYTGGTTGFPKGVMLSHSNLLWCGVSGMTVRGFEKSDVLVYAPPMFHIAGFGSSLMFWVAGGRHAITPVYKPQAVAECIQRERGTDVLLVPTMLQMFVNDPVATREYDLSSLKRMLYAGSPISEALLEQAIATFPGVKFYQAYGQTETSGAVTFLGPEQHSAESRARGRLRSAGLSSCISSVRVVDPEGREAPRGVIGEVAVQGPMVMLGYWNKPEQTAATLRNGWLHTGDAAYMDDEGFFYVVDRLKDMIITGGENVYSAEVENAIARHAAVAQCAVIGIPSDTWGEAVHAFIVCHAGRSLTFEELAAHTRTLIAGYKCPRSMELVESLPISAAGKVLKHQLREPYWRERRGVN